MIKAIHIEDEPRNVELLKQLVKEHCSNVEIIGNAKTVADGLQLVKEKRPQLLYLDIELNNGNSFELLEQLKDEYPEFQVVFITAFNEFAVKAFRYNAVDYLLKPISIKDLKEATEKAVERIKNARENNHIFEALRELKSNFTHQRIGLPVTDGVLFVNTDDIIRCEAKGGYSLVYLTGKKNITCSKTLKEL
jgi:two-component system LytT family response regulator